MGWGNGVLAKVVLYSYEQQAYPRHDVTSGDPGQFDPYHPPAMDATPIRYTVQGSWIAPGLPVLS